MLSSRKAKERKANAKDVACRLYLSFHHRNPTASDPSPLATSLLLADKHPAPDAPSVWRWRVAKEESLSDDGGLAEWAFVTQGGVTMRSVRPLAMVLLGRVPGEATSDVGKVLGEVEVKEAELVWSTEPWLLNALAVSLFLFLVIFEFVLVNRSSPSTGNATYRPAMLYYPSSLGSPLRFDPRSILLTPRCRRRRPCNGPVPDSHPIPHRPSNVHPSCHPTSRPAPSSLPAPSSRANMGIDQERPLYPPADLMAPKSPQRL